MKRLYVWEWVMVLISGGAYFSGLYCGFTKEQAIIIASLFTLALTIVALLSTESIIVALVTFSATGFAAPDVFCNLPVVMIISFLVLLLVGAVYISIHYIIDSRDEIDYHKFLGSLAAEFVVIFVILKYGHLLWNYWQKF
jgi:hypothetical protein